jgi:glycosyltransferase involved in cell wall biosynthesis
MSKDYINVLIVRSIEERALIDLIISVANTLRNENYCFYVAGKGPLLNHYQNIVDERNVKNVKLLGYVSDIELINLYKKCNFVLVTASYGEGFGLPIIEGYLFGKPVLASNVCAIPEVICSSEFLFENNSENIIEKIYLLQNLSFDFNEFYNKKYSNKHILAEMKSLYSKMI